MTNDSNISWKNATKSIITILMNNTIKYPQTFLKQRIGRLGSGLVSLVFFTALTAAWTYSVSSWAESDSNDSKVKSEEVTAANLLNGALSDETEHNNKQSDSIASTNEDWGIEQLLEGLAAVKEAELEFVETKKSFLLTVDLESRGDIVYRAPDYMKKTVREPIVESIAIDGDILTIEKSTLGGKKEEKLHSQSLTISENALANSAVGSIMAIMAGDKSQLSDGYDITMSGQRQAWNLVLQPKLDVIKEKIDQVVLTGSHFEVNLIETTFPDGEQSKLALSYLVVR